MICYDPKFNICRQCLPTEKQHFQTLSKCMVQILEEANPDKYIPPKDKLPTAPKPEKPNALSFFKNLFKRIKF